MPFLQDELLSIGRVESVVARGRHAEVILRLTPPGRALPAAFDNPRSIAATVDDVAQTRLRVRSVKLEGDELRIVLAGLPPRSRRISIRVEGLVPGGDVATVSLVRDAPPFDPGAPLDAPKRETEQQLVSYLFKDFNSFRQLMLDALSHDMPDVLDRHEGDLVVAVIEVLAFAADHLSYFQDAVATEAYLETARRRVSVRRHARLINYTFHEGCTPRTWLQVAPRNATAAIEKGFQAATSTDATGEQRVYETLESQTLYRSLTEMPLWDYGDAAYALRTGATAATVVRKIDATIPADQEPLPKGTVLIFEQRKSTAGDTAGTRCRQAVRLTKHAKNYPHPQDPTKVLSYLEWSNEDALTFDVPVRVANGGYASFVLGNIVAADFGETMGLRTSKEQVDSDGALHLFAPRLTYAVPYDPIEPACSFTDIRPYHAVPAIHLTAAALGSLEREWSPRPDLIGANPYDRAFTVEPEINGAVLVRFGDGKNGTMPDSSTRFGVGWRQGNGSEGRVGPDALNSFDGAYASIERVRNPLPSGGGYDPLDLGKVKRQAPSLVRRQHRCITDADYVERAESVPGVSAAVRRRWTGSGETVDVFVYAQKGAARSRAVVEKVLRESSPIGVQVAVREPRRVGVVVKVALRFTRDANPNDVIARVAAASKAALDVQHLTMGKPLYASWFVTAATSTPGVEQASIVLFRRLDGRTDIEVPALQFLPTEIAVLVDEFGMMTNGRPLVVSA